MPTTNQKKEDRLPTGNCPYCDAERGIQTSWGMSPEGWGNMKDEHDAGHLNFYHKEEKEDGDSKQYIEFGIHELSVKS